MKLAINKETCKGEIVSDFDGGRMLGEGTHRVVDVKFSHNDQTGGAHYIDVWGGTWRVDRDEKTECTVGAMEKWA